MSENRLAQLQAVLQLKFTNSDWLMKAMSAESNAEQRSSSHPIGHTHLAYIGDGVLELAVRSWLCAEQGPENSSGGITRADSLTNKKTLARVGKELGLGDFCYGEVVASIPRSALTGKRLAGLVRAIVGAAFQDAGYDHAAAFIYDRLLPLLFRFSDDYVAPQGVLAHLATRFDLGEASLEYRLVRLPRPGETGPERYRIGVFQGEALLAEGCGSSLAQASRAVGRRALQEMFGFSEIGIEYPGLMP